MREQMEPIVQNAGLKTSIGGAVMAVFGGLSSEWVFGVIGALIALAGYLTTRYYARKRDRREAAREAADEARKQELHRAQLAFLGRKQSPAECDSLDLVEAQTLGIDTADWPPTTLGVANGQ